ncbi:FusB/FusC family EF-G-binding protein [Metabacillus litoralis]|uniref:FusB/FusC family EF-G-binding protein n=1 Tax=Metabacillus litoralis TaxID=152268 RepID=UPI00203F4D45|nr:FusB/FusC family EF-G-binding protein [Metabacillus litoralis]MCM3409754.1 FusB/FusC family EF-G-binding protein [Metabacillus litoralis]
MTEKFLKNEHYNFIKKQVLLIKDSSKKNLPSSVFTSLKDLSNAKILDLIPNISLDQQKILDISRLKTDEEYQQYIQHLTEFLLPFPEITEQKLKKMFPKTKKLKLPDLSKVDHSQLTYLSWNDLRSNRKYIIYELDGELVGIECKFSPTSKKNICSLCKCTSEVSYFSAVTKVKKSNNPDYFKSIGNLICKDSSECNKKITSSLYLENILRDSLGM